MKILPSRLTIAAILGCIIFIPLAIWAGWSAGVADRARVAAEKSATAYEKSITDPLTGYIARLTTCQVSLAGTRTGLDQQKSAIDGLRRAAEDNQAQADRLIRDAQASAAAAERRTQSVLQAQPREGESRCDAAFRLHQENTQ